jgi:hypothetical protein
MNTVISRKIMAAIRTTICLKSLTNSISNQIDYVYYFHYSSTHDKWHVLHTHSDYAFPLNYSAYLFSLTPIRLTTNDIFLGVHFLWPRGFLIEYKCNLKS